jgi:hypothetical protein
VLVEFELRGAEERPASRLAWMFLLRVGEDKPLLSFNILCMCVEDVALWIRRVACYIHD